MPNVSVESEPQLVQPTRNDPLHICNCTSYVFFETKKITQTYLADGQQADGRSSDDLKPSRDSDRYFIQTRLFLLSFHIFKYFFLST